MKRILLTSLSIIAIGVSAYASTMCAANNTVAIVLDPTVAGTNYTYSAANMTWTTNLPYGDVSGVALCSTTSGSYATVGTPDETGGGKYCWCKSTHPVLSRWVFAYAAGSSSNCASYCARDCGDYVRASADFRSSMFGSVAQ